MMKNDRKITYKKDDVIKIRALDHPENWATGKEGGTDHRRYKHSPQKRMNGGTPVGYSGRITLGREQCGM
jgi:hypothetical protein